MTIIVPTWLVVVILCLFVIRTIVFLKRGATMIKGMKTIWPFVKELLSPEREFTIELSKKTEGK